MAKVYRIVPEWFWFDGITVLGRVFAKKSAPQRLIDHEMVHVGQQAADGWRFYVRYTFSRRWRARYEAQAYAVQVRAGESLSAVAALLASWRYLWPCSKSTAAQLIDAEARA